MVANPKVDILGSEVTQAVEDKQVAGKMDRTRLKVTGAETMKANCMRANS